MPVRLQPFDTIRRYFEYRATSCSTFPNPTDVDDKIINRAKRRHHTSGSADKWVAKAFQMRPLCEACNSPSSCKPEPMDDIICFCRWLDRKRRLWEWRCLFPWKNPTNTKLVNKTSRRLELWRLGLNRWGNSPQGKSSWLALKATKPGEISWDSPGDLVVLASATECLVKMTGDFGDTIDIHLWWCWPWVSAPCQRNRSIRS